MVTAVSSKFLSTWFLFNGGALLVNAWKWAPPASRAQSNVLTNLFRCQFGQKFVQNSFSLGVDKRLAEQFLAGQLLTKLEEISDHIISSIKLVAPYHISAENITFRSKNYRMVCFFFPFHFSCVCDMCQLFSSLACCWTPPLLKEKRKHGIPRVGKNSGGPSSLQC